MKKTAQDFAHIPGWGIDADPKNDPTYPNRHRTGEEHDGRSWERPTQQVLDREVLHSIERPDYTAVVGNSVPPSGLSGMIRRFAFKYSENSYLHWLPLVMADKVNVVEGLLDDLAHGTVPNIWAEKGYNSEWKHDKKSLFIKLGTVAALTAGVVYLMTSNNKGSKPKRG
ncbi:MULTISPECIES: hypothetical protein [Hymenobacter]|uniref:Uncharacterized protein n=3 Tax=Hymenobacter TaxID=89966 RepID=A0A4Z0MD68_9BACT|nr:MULTISPECIES: hypothetical protein [Hymenobacter]TGD77434.1 hypothetical protein EU557_24045 [Hymenobacter wooponensis]UPL51376.1 hypothetical protein MWH26_19775 [Hymenobacter sublimis]SNR98301.1 hypothetical protein SAMN06269173_1152 [Hymenobacter mucosus]